MGQINIHHASPAISLLSAGQRERVHDQSLKILEGTGIRVESEKARKIFARSGSVSIKDDIVLINRELVDHSIKGAMSMVDIFDTSGNKAFEIGRGQRGGTRFGIGVTNISYQEVYPETVVPFGRKHSKIVSGLSSLLDNFDMLSTPGVPSDIDPPGIDLYNALDMYANSGKPMVLLVTESNNMDRVFDLLSHLHGDISERPFIMVYLNLITPLVLNEATTDKMISTIERGVPVIFSNYGMYGATSPMSEAGTLTLLNAELLAGLVFARLVSEESKVILGSLPAGFDMRTMGSFYSTSSYLLNIACAEMMDHYDIPHCGTSGSGAGWGADLITSGHYWMNHLTGCLGRVGIAPFVGGNFDSLVFSPASAVLSDHIIGEARKFMAGISLDDRSIGLEEIIEAGHGGNYFLSRATIESMADSGQQKGLWPPMNLNSWKGSGSPGASSFLFERAMELVEKAGRRTDKSLALEEKGEKFIRANG